MKQLILNAKLGLIFSLCSLLFACAGTSPKANLYTLNTLTADSIASSQTSSENAHIRIQVMPISIDETVDRPQIVITRADHQVTYLEQQRWAQPLKYEIGRVLGMHLNQHIENSIVSAYPHQLSDASIQVHLQVIAFESSFEQGASIKANVMVVNTKTKQSVSESLVFSQHLADNAATNMRAMIDAHNQNLQQLSQAVIANINQVR